MACPNRPYAELRDGILDWDPTEADPLSVDVHRRLIEGESVLDNPVPVVELWEWNGSAWIDRRAVWEVGPVQVSTPGIITWLAVHSGEETPRFGRQLAATVRYHTSDRGPLSAYPRICVATVPWPIPGE